ncbi:hypothetical protein [Anaeromicropila populeti]|uniref:Uncharacterized protein n=1 Tax=Anaeromicropila populeti TaxID=37658 RepID=A0A1I6JPX2_9FIRM|nr:hypothetical protein [Anaeromicropila populeti]SFR81004.1 hypothetical protein SAMN05661086_01854 [Anaeromicropila populeti]
MQFSLLSEEEAIETNGGIAFIGALVIWGCCAALGAATGAGIYVGYKQAEEAHK